LHRAGLRESIPSYIHITDGKCQDINVLNIIAPEVNVLSFMDKAYVDFEAIYRMNDRSSLFILTDNIHLTNMAVK
jgi:hypothetical protein